MTRFAIDAETALALVERGESIPQKHLLGATNRMRSDALGILYRRVREQELSPADALVTVDHGLWALAVDIVPVATLDDVFRRTTCGRSRATFRCPSRVNGLDHGELARLSRHPARPDVTRGVDPAG